MDKNTIKRLVRENLMSKLKEAKPKAPEKKESDIDYDKAYGEIQTKLDETLFKASQVMEAAGLGKADDATARSLFIKKLHKEPNGQGSFYKFNTDELAKIIKVINNPSPYV